MKMLPVAAAVAAVVVSGCATTSPETISCLEPNRRVMIEVGGHKLKPPAPPKTAGGKPGKPKKQNVVLTAYVQGDSAWDYGDATLKDGGKAAIDKLLKTVESGTRRDKRPTNVGSVVITGHSDQTEAADSGNAALDEERARAVHDYLVAQGMSPNIIFFEGRDAEEPLHATRFCAV